MNTKIIVNTAMLLITKLGFAQVEINGTVFDKETNKPVTGASIVITNTLIGTTSDNIGEFTLLSGNGIGSITVSCVGYKTEVVEKVTPGMNINLTPLISELGEVVINGEYTKPVKKTSDAIYTGSALTSKGVKLMGVFASASVYNAIDLLPGVNVESSDAYGLSEKSVRIRCIKDNFSGMTIDGFPNYGIMPIGARDDIYDMENMQQVAVYKGGVPADLGSATGSKGGVIELQYKRAREKFGVQINQWLGMDNYTRSFARIDFGRLKTKTGIFVSYSFSQTDKWKGPGQLGPRDNVAVGVAQPIGNKVELEVFANYNEIDRHDFKSLTYEEAKDINNNYNLDFNATLTGNPEDDFNYYAYNGGNFINRDILSTLSYKLSNDQKVRVKYYVSSEDADFNEGTPKGSNYFVFNRKRDIDRMGVIPELSGEISKIKYTAGYWFESCDNNAYVYSSTLTINGIQPTGYSYYTVKGRKGQVHSPYAKVSYTKGKFHFQTGMKYFYFMDPESESYTSVTPVTLPETPDPSLHTDKIKFGALLPTVGIGYNFSSKLGAYFNYGRNYMRPYMYSPVISLYIKNQQVFMNNNMTLQSIFDKWKMETSDHFDFGIRYSTEKITFSPTIFYAKHHDVLASAYDPVVELDYYQNVGELNALGADMECYVYPVEKLMVFVNPSYMSMSYDNELYRKTNDGYESIAIKAKQSPATPKLSLKSGVSYSVKSFDITAKMKYVGIRYGDATNEEKIMDYTLVDASVKYSKENLWKIKEWSIGIELKNIFDKKYVGGIDVSDDSVQGNATYYAGVPFTAVGSLCVKF